MKTLGSGLEDWIEMLALLFCVCMILIVLFACLSSGRPPVKWRQLWQLLHWINKDYNKDKDRSLSLHPTIYSYYSGEQQ